MDKLLPNMVILEKEEREALPSFCSFINDNKDSLSDYQKSIIADYIISNVAFCNVKTLNSGIYNMLRNYLMANIGDISFSLYGNSIREITLGNNFVITTRPFLLTNHYYYLIRL